MKSREPLKAFLQTSEIRTVGNAQERAAFIAIRVEGETVREAAQTIGVSKSQIPNLAAAFIGKLGTKMRELERKRVPVSREYLELRGALLRHLHEVQEESGSDDFGIDDTKIGHFRYDGASREDLAEAFGTALRDPDD